MGPSWTLSSRDPSGRDVRGRDGARPERDTVEPVSHDATPTARTRPACASTGAGSSWSAAVRSPSGGCRSCIAAGAERRASSRPRRRPASRACAARARSSGIARAVRATATSTAPGTSSPPPTTAAVNERVSAEAEARADLLRPQRRRAPQATAWTPAIGRHGPLTVAVLGSRDPRRSAAVRDEILDAAAQRRDRGAASTATRTPGVVLVGGGPGDPELITVAGRRALQEADVVVADRLAPRELLAELRRDVELVDATKLPRGRAADQEAINRLLVERRSAGKRVVRFKGGDPFVFGRGFEEVLACAAAGVPCRVDPGRDQRRSRCRRSPASRSRIAASRTSSPSSRGHLPPGHPESLVDWEARGPAARHARPADGRREPRRDRRRAGRGTAATPRTPGRPWFRTGRCHGERTVFDPRHGRRRGRRRAGAPAGDRRRRRRGRVSRTRDVWTAGPRADDAGRPIASTTPPTRAWPTTATCATSSCASTSRPSTGFFIAEGEKVVRRAVAAGYAPRSFLMTPRWLDGLRRRARRRSTRPATSSPRPWPSRSPASTCTAGRSPRCAGAAADRRRGPRRRPAGSLVLEDVVDHTNVGAILRCARRARVDARAAVAALRRPAVPPVGQGGDGCGLLAAVDPRADVVRRACRLSAPGSRPSP